MADPEELSGAPDKVRGRSARVQPVGRAAVGRYVIEIEPACGFYRQLTPIADKSIEALPDRDYRPLQAAAIRRKK